MKGLQLELITFEILAAERLRLMKFDNQLIYYLITDLSFTGRFSDIQICLVINVLMYLRCFVNIIMRNLESTDGWNLCDCLESEVMKKCWGGAEHISQVWTQPESRDDQ